MISSAFKSAYQNEVSQRNQGISTVTQGVKDAATAIIGITGFAGGLGKGAFAKGAEHALAGRVGGVGGNIMLATLQQKKETAKENKEKQYSAGEVLGSLQGNPINRSAIKTLNTVFDFISNESDYLNKQGKIETSMGEIDPASELGKQIMGGLKK